MKRVPHEETYRYWIAKMDGEYLIDIVEKPSIEDAPSNNAIFTPYIVHKKFLENLQKVEPDPSSGEIYPWPAMQKILTNKEMIWYVTDHPLWDTGNPEAWMKANIELGQNPELFDA